MSARQSEPTSIPCPKCGSENTTFSSRCSPLAFLNKLAPRKRLPVGACTLVCKDCGHRAVIMVD